LLDISLIACESPLLFYLEVFLPAAAEIDIPWLPFKIYLLRQAVDDGWLEAECRATGGERQEKG